MNRMLIQSMVFLLSILFSASSLYAQVLVISPHPDDDVIMAAGVVSRAIDRGEQVTIVYMTNGDYLGTQAGYTRQGEAVMGQSYLGVPESDLLFLGYPDGYLNRIFTDYVNPTDVFVTPNSGVSATYGNRGLGDTDYHSYRFGHPAGYNRSNILVDLQDILSTFRPVHIFVPSQFDSHPDHSTTYQLLRMALASVCGSNPGYAPVIHKTIVWWGSGYAWPNPSDPTAYYAQIPDLDPNTDLSWTDRESIDVPLSMQATEYSVNPKALALDAHRYGQHGVYGFIGNSLHKDEVFWVENVVGVDPPPIVNAGLDQAAMQGTVVRLDGSQSRDPGGNTLTFQWVQASGIPVSLSDPTSSQPTFAVPAGLSQNETLTFELIVSNGHYTSIPDSVSVTALVSQPATTNIAPLATVTASSESPQYQQSAAKAVDGVVDGYLEVPYPYNPRLSGDYTREWATAGEGVGAWLRLSWPVPYTVDRVVIFDRPNFNDNIVSATLTFSDGSNLALGVLNNDATGTEFRFPARVITSVMFRVTGVSSSAVDIGLAEIQVYGNPVGLDHYGLALNVSPAGAGTVSVNPSGTAFVSGQRVTLTATPSVGYAFANWSGDATGPANPLTITMNGARTVTANFAMIPGTLAVTPVEALNASGRPGGPFTSSNINYMLQNTGGTSIDWRAAATQNWVGLSSTGGTLAPGANATVTVSINSNAASLAVGTYSDTVSFSNITSANGSTSRAVNLTIANQPLNIAPLAMAVASSDSPQYQQTAAKAVDGVADGYPGDYTREWATAGEGAGAWLQLSWPVPYAVDRVVLFDRPNLSDNVLSGLLTFSDGSSLAVGPLSNNGTATEFSFTARVITGLTFRVTGVSSSTLNAGLSEIQVFGNPASQSQYGLTMNADPSGAGTVSVNPGGPGYYSGQQVTLTATPSVGYAFANWSGDATGSNNPLTVTMSGDRTVTANFAAIPGTIAVTPAVALNASGAPGGPFSSSSASYTLQNTGGASINWTASSTQSWVGLSSSSGTLAPGASATVTVSINSSANALAAGSYADTVTFSNLTNANGDTSREVNLSITQQAVNIAPLATLSASSDSPQYQQTAAKAVDGVADGYPGNYTCEWATAGQGIGAWITLTWTVPHSVSRVVLYDRPNSDDQIVSGTLTFSDGSSLVVGPLNNVGSAAEYTFPARTVTSLTLTVTGVSSRTLNVGLAEIQVY